MHAFRLALIVAALVATLPAYAGKAHVHGTGTLDIGIDRGQFSIALELPLDAATGFERAPKTDREKADLAQAAKVLNDAATLFVPTPAAKCSLTDARVSVPFLDGKALPVGEHADIEAEYRFRCTDPAALKGVETTLFRHFKRLYRLEAQRVGPAGQGAGRLTPKQPAIAW